ncbi:formimidoylglutamase [Marinithermofilum abyssi]|uniref:Formimidoylglutamase n=1 Tax=Marinithermofilum abyssi TaxID=1571185 RepID=A0A8J2VGF8_9BACL|nr:agmatinase family protein [Marinithermofilum abyssi]GGE08957.1 formimidoylglutamase [Marinithermofilum abyssi]
MPFHYIQPPVFINRAGSVDRFDRKVSQWIVPWEEGQEVEAGLIGVPLSRSSISPSAASEAPNALRGVWKSFAAYDVDHDVDLTRIRAADFGDIAMHVTDIPRCHQNIEAGVLEMLEASRDFPSFLPVILGGDHSITCPALKGLARFHTGKRIGLIQFDTHFDVRNLEDGGPSNGTPIRGLLESGTLRGEDIFQIGIHSFANALAHKEYAEEQGITYATMRQVRQEGLLSILERFVKILRQQVDGIYITVDIDVLDLACLPGSPGPSPGGMQPWELFDAVHRLGQEDKVLALDLVCLDPFRDRGQLSVKTGAHVILSFLSGYCQRLQQKGP